MKLLLILTVEDNKWNFGGSQEVIFQKVKASGSDHLKAFLIVATGHFKTIHFLSNTESDA